MINPAERIADLQESLKSCVESFDDKRNSAQLAGNIGELEKLYDLTFLYALDKNMKSDDHTFRKVFSEISNNLHKEGEELLKELNDALLI